MRGKSWLVASALMSGALLWSSQPVPAGFMQQGPKLIGMGLLAEQGYSVALSGDGNTAIVGGPNQNADAGAAWVFTLVSGVWTQQAKLVGTGVVGSYAQQGWSVALSGDGNTAIVGGPADSAGGPLLGAAWIFTRSGGVWSQQAKLVGAGACCDARQGWSVALSGDGDTAIVGGPNDNNSVGAAWVYTQSGGVWTQQGPKLVGTMANDSSLPTQGWSVSLSDNGDTAIVGGPRDSIASNPNGAAWVFTRSGANWTPGGTKLPGGTGATTGQGTVVQGWSVALSGDGKTAIVGGPFDNSLAGAAWVYTLIDGVWTQQGLKLVGSGPNGKAQQGSSVALSNDGNIAIVGGPYDADQAGAAWVFTRNGPDWTPGGTKLLLGTGEAGAAEQGASVALSATGYTAIVGGPLDGGSEDGNAWVGAAWVYTNAGSLAATPTTGQPPLAVTFHAGGLAPGNSYTITFGDGATGPVTLGNCLSDKCSGSASHTYKADGTEVATLLNGSGFTVSTATITVGVGGVRPNRPEGACCLWRKVTSP
jgi:hypothetical protein